MSRSGSNSPTCLHHPVIGEDQWGVAGQPQYLDQQQGGLWDWAQLGHEAKQESLGIEQESHWQPGEGCQRLLICSIFSWDEQLKKWRCHFVRPFVHPFVTSFFFASKGSYGALKPYQTLSNKTNKTYKTYKTSKTSKTNKTKGCTNPSQLPDPTKGLF